MASDVKVATSSTTVRVRSDRTRLIILAVAAAILAALFMVLGASGLWEYVLPRRATRLIAIILSGTAIATSTVVFQTDRKSVV